MLLGLPPLIAHKTMVIHGLYGNGDGTMILFPKDETKGVYIFRLCYTDSGHYLLPTDDPQCQTDEEQQLAVTAIDALGHTINKLNFVVKNDDVQQFPVAASPAPQPSQPDVSSDCKANDCVGCKDNRNHGVAASGSASPAINPECSTSQKDTAQVEPESASKSTPQIVQNSVVANDSENLKTSLPPSAEELSLIHI